jgi:hypothetical protein
VELIEIKKLCAKIIDEYWYNNLFYTKVVDNLEFLKIEDRLGYWFAIYRIPYESNYKCHGNTYNCFIQKDSPQIIESKDTDLVLYND